MLTPKAAYLTRLLGKSAEQHAQWLVRGLREYLFGSDSRDPRDGDAFPGAAAFINEGTSVIEDLARVVRVFPEDDLDTFRSACARAISKLDLDVERDLVIAEHIISLAVQVGAYEILDALMRLPSRVRRPAGIDRLFAKALSAMHALAEPGYKDIVACARDLVNAWKPFPPEQSGLALRVMTRASPGRLLDHLRFLYEPMEKYYGREAHDDGVEQRRRFVIRDIADIVFSSAVIARTAERGVRCPQDPRAWQYDWWANTLSTSEDSKIAALRDRLGLPQPGIDQLAFAALQADCDWAGEPDEQDDPVSVTVPADTDVQAAIQEQLLRARDWLAAA